MSLHQCPNRFTRPQYFVFKLETKPIIKSKVTNKIKFFLESSICLTLHKVLTTLLNILILIFHISKTLHGSSLPISVELELTNL